MSGPSAVEGDEPERSAAPRRRRVGKILVAASVATALVFGGCTALPGLLRGGEEVALTHEPGELPPLPDGTLAGFQAQQPDWNECDVEMQCADVYAPVDWEDPAAGALTLRLVKREASGDAKLGTLFVNPGGPGASGADYIAAAIDSAIPAEIREAYDVIGWDPRGVGASSPVSCGGAAEMDDYLFGVDDGLGALEAGSDAWIDAALAEAAAFGERCAAETGERIGYVDTMSTVRDLDMLRAIVGDDRLHYLGFSYGTYLGARYADAYPERVGRLVLDGAMDPTTSLADVVREQTLGFEKALRVYVQACLRRDDCPLSGSVDEAMASIGAMLDGVDAAPLTGSDGRRVAASTLLTAIIAPLYTQSNWGYLDDLFASVPEGDADVALALADFYYDREGGAYRSNSTEAFSAINCLDYPRDFDRDRMRAEAAELDRIAPTIGRFQGFGDISCEAWPVPGAQERRAVTAAGAAPILVVGTTGDPATPYRWAESLAEQLDSGVLVSYRGEGHTAYGESSCVDETVDAYLLTGAVPADDPMCTA
ncbi:alpha/beta hydrolase [Leucobacter allii]|uniref:alpha/beta hydrolase n=1 Tax=Leucobacter allii TaxID=2932247 RepID=UPI001FD06769|nr:alpha/beta hydrolase [Leucobacter allii]UOR01756.1 alpha/beta hydrolase [Leucobacter allii]